MSKTLSKTPESAREPVPWEGSKDLSCFLSLFLLRAESKLPRIQQTQYVPRNFSLRSSGNNTLRIIDFSSQEQPTYILGKSILTSQQIGPVNGVEHLGRRVKVWLRNTGSHANNIIMLLLRIVCESMYPWCPSVGTMPLEELAFQLPSPFGTTE